MKNKILDYISSHSGQVLRKTNIRRALCENSEDKDLFKTALKALVADGEISREGGGIYKKSSLEYITGRITVKEGAFGFLDIAESTESVFIPPGYTYGAFSGDLVKVLITEPGNKRGPVGKVVEIVEPAFTFLLGQLAEEHGRPLVRPLRSGSPDIRIDKAQLEEFPQVTVGDWLKIEIVERTQKYVKGSIIEKVGDAGNLNHELDAVMSEFGLDPMYTAEEEASAGRLKQRDIKRTDLTRETIMTIDPTDAKDFDDALSIHNHDDPKLITIGVHIADVAAYISPNGVWQKKVRRRCFTAYLPGRMVPMLPKVLVSNRCSLVEGEDKPAHTVLLHINRETGKVEDYERFHSTINVKKRLNYKEVQEFADNKFKNPEWPTEVKGPLKELFELSLKMRQWRRENDKFIPLEAPEVRVLCDHNTMELTGLKHEKQGQSNQMVEEYMLACNVAVAKELTNKQLPGLYRVHPEPNPESIEEFTASAQSIYGLQPGDLSHRGNAVKFLNEISKLPEAEVISFDFLRMMQRALYSEKASIHYGLGKGLYSHFTSPIRRMSDLIVHQQLWELENGKAILSNKSCATEAVHITEMEGKIDDAYRAAILRFKLYYIRQQMDGGLKQVQAFVSRITPKGMKVFIQDFGLYCSIHIKNFDNDYYELDDFGRFLTGTSTGITFKCGDKIQVLLSDINFARRELIVKPAFDDMEGKEMPKFGKKEAAGKKTHRKGKSKNNRQPKSRNKSSKDNNTSPKDTFAGKTTEKKGKKVFAKRKNRNAKKKAD
jgi:ribonuclease R